MTTTESQWMWLAVTLLVFAGIVVLDTLMIRNFGTEGSFSYAIGMGFRNYPVPMAMALISVGVLFGHAMFPVIPR